MFIDLEHGGLSDSELVNHVIASRIPTLVRLSESTELAVKRAADSGADALVCPHVRSAAMAAALIRWAHYPPAGERSVGLSRNTLLGYGLASALQRTDRPSVIAQIEDSEGITDIKAICETPGLASVFVGPYDLSASLGIPGRLSEDSFVSAARQVAIAAHAARILAGIFAPSCEAWATFIEYGFDYVVLRSDSLFLAEAATTGLKVAREHWASGIAQQVR